jgi:hypothetical protein
VLLALLSGCTENYVMQAPRAPSAAESGTAESTPTESVPTESVPSATAEISITRVRVFPKGSSPSQRMEVVGVLDFHTQADSQDKGFADLRVHAAAMGADAVIDAEFEHGEGSEPSHLSGVAVRFVAD